MGTIVFQGLQSCLESQMVESRTLRLRLSAPKPPLQQFPTHSLELSLKPAAAAVESGGWSFLQALSDPTPSNQVLKPVSAPSPPYTVKRTVSSLSDKSLELCTENLGSETGTDHVSTTDADRNFLFGSGSESPTPAVAAESRPSSVGGSCYGGCNYKRSRNTATVRRGSGDFPPPLTTMRGPELVQVRRPHREGGRLVIEAVKSRSQPSCFEAERIDGRLRLHVAVVKDSAFDSSPSVVTASEKIAEGNGGGEEILIREGEGEITERRNNNDNNNRNANANANSAWRCKEEGGQHESTNNNNKGLLNWEPFWVTTASLQV